MAPGLTSDDLPVATERLTLRPYRPGDAAALLALLSDPGVVRYLYSEPLRAEGLSTAMEQRVRPATVEAEGDVVKLAAELRATGQYVGEMTLFHRSSRDRRGEIGYVVSPRFSGRGLATEGAAALLRLGFEVVGFHRIEAQCDGRNLASARVMERLGMRREAHFIKNEFVKGEWTDALVYAVLAEEWRGRGTPGPLSG